MERCCCHQSILYIRNTKVCKIYIFACLLKWQFSEILVQKNSSSSLSPWNKKSANHTVIIRTLQLITTCVMKIAELHAHIAKTIVLFIIHPRNFGTLVVTVCVCPSVHTTESNYAVLITGVGPCHMILCFYFVVN